MAIRALLKNRITRLAASALLASSTCNAAAQDLQTDNASFHGCYARWTDKQLIIGNHHVERTWAIEDGALRPTGFLDREAHMQWLAHPTKLPAPRLSDGFRDTHAQVTISTSSGSSSPVEAESLSVTVKSTVAHGIRYSFQVFPEARGISVSVQPEGGDSARALSVAKQDNALGADDPTPQLPDSLRKRTEDAAVLEDLSLAPPNLRFTQVTLVDHSDVHSELVFTREWMFLDNESEIFAHGDLFFVEDVVTGNGLIFLKEAPLPSSRPIDEGMDFQVLPNQRTFRMLGLSYPEIVIAYRGGRTGRIAALQTYQQQLRPYVPGRDGRLLTNTWGDGSKKSRIGQDFMEKEISAGASLGIEVAQMDDGWQNGREVSPGSAAVSSGFWDFGTFWDVNPQRFPQGFQPLVDASAARGIQLGLWYAPDSKDDFANRERDVARVLELHRKYGISYFKFDFMKVNTPAADRNLHALIERVLSESKGAITIDLDITADKRPGYFGLMNAGPLFVENRYTEYGRYLPHIVLRNLWNLSQFIDPLRLRMEFLNNERNRDKYGADPLAPGAYKADALFATVMMASPVGWFESSNLSPAFIKAAAPLIAVWKRERDRLYRGITIPIGDEPDGVSWTGFTSITQDQGGGYMLLFRESNDGSERNFPLSPLGPVKTVTVLAGRGTAQIDGASLHVEIPEKLQYLWVRLDR